VLDLLVGELVQAMALAGAATVADLRPDMVASIG
jgi:hypothetical protein